MQLVSITACFSFTDVTVEPYARPVLLHAGVYSTVAACKLALDP